MLDINFNFPNKIEGQIETVLECSNGHKQKVKVNIKIDLLTKKPKIITKSYFCRKCNETIKINQV